MENMNCCEEKEACTVIKQYYGCCRNGEAANEAPTIGENGNWFIGDEDTGVRAQGPQGEPGIAGETGPVGPQGAQGETGPAGQSVDMTFFRPDTWVPGREYDFGGGLYGQRFVGNITTPASAEIETVLGSLGRATKIVMCDGWWSSYNGGCISLCSSFRDEVALSAVYINDKQAGAAADNLIFASLSIFDRTNAPYDIWVKYTK